MQPYTPRQPKEPYNTAIHNSLDSQCEADTSAVQCSCPELLLGKQLLGMFPFPEGTESSFWKDQPVGGVWTGLTRY